MNIPVLLKELAKVGVIALTEESVKSFVEAKIKPIFANWGKEESRSIELEECLSEYMLRCYGKNNIMTTIVFGRLQKTLEDLYIPLTLEEYKNKNKQWVINENCYDILDNYSRILIVDMAGMGKSTIVKYFACQGVNVNKCIPVVIELRRLEKKQTILEYIQKQINSYDKNIEIGEIVDILKKGDFVIFFDGYDEIANENKPDILDAIQEFTSKASNTKTVITSREDDDLNSLGEYKCVNIKPLTKEEAYKLIEKYDNGGEISKKLIKRLKEDSSMKVLSEFLKNPLLVSLLYKTFEYKEEIPYKKIDFYEQVYAALFNDHDKTKGSAYVHEKKTKLDRLQFEHILRTFGFLCLKADKVEYSDQIIHELLEKSVKRFVWVRISIEDFLYDITHAVPFIQKDGNEYKWVHKSFMEYFASCFICYDNKEYEEKCLIRMLTDNNSMKYYNVLEFCYEIDTLGFRKYVILPYLEKYIKRYQQVFNDNWFSNVDENIILLAKDLLSVSNFINITIQDDSSSMIKYEFDIIDEALFKILNEKIPEIFKKDDYLSGNRIKVEKIIYKHSYILNDDIDNPIYTNKEFFCRILYDVYDMFLGIYSALDYEKCKKMIKEIESVDIAKNSDIFDW